MRIIGIDPGETTGIAIYNDDVWQYHQLEGEHFEDLEWLLKVERPDVVVCESFQKRNNPGANTKPLLYIGAINGYCLTYNIELVFQTPSQGKAFWTNNKLKACGLYTAGLKHAMDATRHVLLYLLNTKTLPQKYLDLLKSQIDS